MSVVAFAGIANGKYSMLKFTVLAKIRQVAPQVTG